MVIPKKDFEVQGYNFFDGSGNILLLHINFIPVVGRNRVIAIICSKSGVTLKKGLDEHKHQIAKDIYIF